MESVVNLLMLILILVWSISIGVGFDLKKPFSWLYVLSGFLIGLLLTTMSDQKFGIQVGVLLALISIWGGPLTFKRRQHYKK